MAKNSMLLYGRNSVLERLKADPQSIIKIFIQDKLRLPQIERLIQERRIPVERLSSAKLFKIKPSRDLQGVIARVKRFQYADFKRLLENKLTPIFLDRINDPQNLGAIIRTAACLGGFAVVIPQFNACGVTEAVLHVASGGENFVPVSMVSNIAQAIISAKKKGYWIMGAVVEPGARALNKIDLPFPLGIVLGSEAGGIRYGVQKQLDLKACIPMRGAGLSFNVAIACSIFCYELCRIREAGNEKK